MNNVSFEISPRVPIDLGYTNPECKRNERGGSSYAKIAYTRIALIHIQTGDLNK